MDAFRILRKTLPRHLLQPSICRSALLYTLRIPSYLFKGSPILLFWFYAFVPTNGSFQLCRLNKVWSFPIGIHALGTTTSADFSQFVVTTANETVRETSRDKPASLSSSTCLIYIHGLRLPFGLCCPKPAHPPCTPCIRFLSVKLRFRYPFFSPIPHDINLGSRFGVRRQLRPLWTFTTD